MSVSAIRRQRATRTKVPPGLCGRCMGRVRWIGLDGARWKFDPTRVDPRGYASPPAYPVWRGRAWRVAALLEYLTDHFELSEREAQLIIDSTPWHVLHTCPRGADSRDDGGPE